MTRRRSGKAGNWRRSWPLAMTQRAPRCLGKFSKSTPSSSRTRTDYYLQQYVTCVFGWGHDVMPRMFVWGHTWHDATRCKHACCRTACGLEEDLRPQSPRRFWRRSGSRPAWDVLSCSTQSSMRLVAALNTWQLTHKPAGWRDVVRAQLLGDSSKLLYVLDSSEQPIAVDVFVFCLFEIAS